MNNILEKFMVISEYIVDIELLKQYIEFCITNNKQNKIIGSTSDHHILPASKLLPFKQWSNLKDHPWNKSILTYSDHYKAHYLLMKAINHISTYIAFSGMHKKDFSLGRITEDDLIPEDEFNLIWKVRNEKISEKRLEKIIVNGEEMTLAKYYVKNRTFSEDEIKRRSIRWKINNPSSNKLTLEKIRNTKSSSFIDGKNIDKISAEKAAETMRKLYISDDNNMTSIYKESGKKLSNYLLEIEENGNTRAKNKNKLIHFKLRQKGKWYKLMNIFDPNYQEILPAAEIRKISPGLEKCLIDNYLGKSKYGKNYLEKMGKKSIIGLYVERIELIHQ